ncbi:response regulator [Leeia sp. TBRC 13508]|uniref:histidine kinase n=1 Tax=Leeia speluncae TaxID=2884804 RepID=A0ABS8D5E1_9NEIS|nr:response regulator [Leeia speluncae]MCB6182838.1 response regulator [Leeia speluncae]
MQQRSKFWLMIGVGLILLNGAVWLAAEHFQEKESLLAREKLIHDQKQQRLYPKAAEIESSLHAIYTNIRTISLLPSVRALEGSNPVSNRPETGKSQLSNTDKQTIQQLFNNLRDAAQVHEIYGVLKGIDVKSGQEPVFMFDHPDLGYHSLATPASETEDKNAPKPYELAEYGYFPIQIQQLEKIAPVFLFSNVNQIPAIFSPSVRTCDNTQYYSKTECSVKDTEGILYSVPFYSQKTNRLTGVISAIFRTNMLEAMLVGTPRLLVTPRDKTWAKEQHVNTPAVSNFLLENKRYQLHIFDRRNQLISNYIKQPEKSVGEWQTLPLKIEGDSDWTLSLLVPETTLAKVADDAAEDVVRDWLVIFLLVEMSAVIAWLGYRAKTHGNEINRRLEQDRNAAENANRTKSAFLANMSHEIRTPMNAVIGFSNLLKTTPLNEQQRGYLDAVLTSGDALLGLINDILDYSKIEAGHLELERISFNLRQVLEDSIEIMSERAAQKQVELIGMFPTDLPDKVLGDPGRLRQVVINLLSNAIKFTESGHVACKVDVVEKANHLYVCRFEVKDTGIGMSPEVVAKLFQPFTQADASTTRRFGGTGLGLSISQRLISAMGGKISATSQQGSGSAFSFELAFEAQEDHAAPMKEVSLIGKRVVVVDDNTLNLKLMQEILPRWGMEVICFHSGEAALQDLHHLAPVDLAILDMEMPNMDGVMLQEALRHQLPYTMPVILLTSSGVSGQKKQAELSGFAGFLSKPFRHQQLLSMLQAVLEMAETPEAQMVTEYDVPVRPESTHRILVAEDNPINQKLTRIMVEKAGYTVVIAENGQEALDYALSSSFDLILMDCQMPVMDGLEATRHIRAMGVNLPIIALTANAFDEDRTACLEAGMNDFLTKPISQQTLVDMLDKWHRQS